MDIFNCRILNGLAKKINNGKKVIQTINLKV